MIPALPAALTTSRSDIVFGTVVSITTVTLDTEDVSAAIDRAFAWCQQVEALCSRFDADSELMQLTRHIGVAVPVSDLLFEVVQFALALAHETGGAFDPTVGRAMEARGFNREHRSGALVRSGVDAPGDVNYRDVDVSAADRTITLHRPLVLDLGAVAKGFAIDMAARELQPYRDFAIDAGGDLYLGGRNTAGELWSVGIRHPRVDGQLIDMLLVSDRAVCTSGDYERRTDEGHHILDPRSGAPATAAASVTVVAPTAMLADAVATAAFVLGPAEGIALCERLQLQALVVTPNLERHETRGLRDS